MEFVDSISVNTSSVKSPSATETQDRSRDRPRVTQNSGETQHDKTELTPSTNNPHPSLEFPPLYLVLKNCFPKLLDNIRRIYSCRWSLSYPLQKRVRGSNILRHLGIYLTYGEILLFIPITVLALVCIYQTFIEPSCPGTGRLARLSVLAALLFAQKNSYITFLLGIPFDRAVTYHKVSGYVAVVTGMLHGYTYLADSRTNVSKIDGNRFHEFVQGPMNTSGTMILLFILGMYFTALPIVRRKLFEFFLIVHLILLVGIIGATAVHTGYMVPLMVAGTTGVDYFIRKVIMARCLYPKKATLKIISESVVQVSFPKVASFDYNPGQYVYIAVPALSNFQWHPFSLSSAPHQSIVTMHVRVAGNWTAALHKLASTKSEIPILLEGPYGNFGVDVMNEKKYKVCLLLSGGIGLTQMQSMFSHLLHEQNSSVRNLKKLKFVWIQRDPDLMVQSHVASTSASIHALKQEAARKEVDKGDTMGDQASLVSRILASVPPSGETDAELDTAYQLPDMESTMQLSETGESQCDGSIPDEESEEGLEEIDLERVGDVVDIEIYLTKGLDDAAAHNVPGLQMGRPDLSALFSEMRDEAISLNERRVAVCVCGPKRISDLCRKVCIQLSDKRVRFDYHEEAFG